MLNVLQHPASYSIPPPMKQPCTYVLASGPLGTLYIGVTADLIARLDQHRTGISGFASRYGAIRLVRYEFYADMPAAIAREKQLTRWHRGWKIDLVRSENPDFVDLATGLGSPPVLFHRGRGHDPGAGP